MAGRCHGLGVMSLVMGFHVHMGQTVYGGRGWAFTPAIGNYYTERTIQMPKQESQGKLREARSVFLNLWDFLLFTAISCPSSTGLLFVLLGCFVRYRVLLVNMC